MGRRNAPGRTPPEPSGAREARIGDALVGLMEVAARARGGRASRVEEQALDAVLGVWEAVDDEPVGRVEAGQNRNYIRRRDVRLLNIAAILAKILAEVSSGALAPEDARWAIRAVLAFHGFWASRGDVERGTRRPNAVGPQFGSAWVRVNGGPEEGSKKLLQAILPGAARSRTVFWNAQQLVRSKATESLFPVRQTDLHAAVRHLLALYDIEPQEPPLAWPDRPRCELTRVLLSALGEEAAAAPADAPAGSHGMRHAMGMIAKYYADSDLL